MWRQFTNFAVAMGNLFYPHGLTYEKDIYSVNHMGLRHA